MEGTKFRTAPDVINYKIPFELNEKALTEWLNLVSLEQSYFSCKEIFCVLQAFCKLAISPGQHLLFLHKISANLNELVDHLEKSYLDASFPAENEAQACIEMVAFSYSMLAENYALLGHKLLDQNKARNKDRALIFYLALSAAGRAFLNMAQGYMQPYEGFWLFCHRLYRLAEQHGLLTLTVTPETVSGNTIDAAYKQILLFDRVDTNQYRPREMKAIYAILQQFSGHTEIVKKYAQEINGLFVFNLNEDKRPKELTQRLPYKDPADRYIAPIHVAKSLYLYLQRRSSLNNELISENRKLCFRIVKSLSLSQKRKYARSTEHRHGLGIIGYDNIIQFLHRKDLAEKNNLFAQQKNNTRIFGNWRAPDMNYPESDEWLEQMMVMSFSDALTINKNLKPAVRDVKEPDLWSFLSGENARWAESIPIGDFEIINSSSHGFHASWNTINLKVKIGDIFAIPSDQGDKVHVGIIRRIERPTHENVRLSIELVGFECEIIGIVRQREQKSVYEAIFLPGIKGLNKEDSIICKNGDLLPNEDYCIHRGNEQILCQLYKILNSTESIRHIELKYPGRKL